MMLRCMFAYASKSKTVWFKRCAFNAQRLKSSFFFAVFFLS